MTAADLVGFITNALFFVLFVAMAVSIARQRRLGGLYALLFLSDVVLVTAGDQVVRSLSLAGPLWSRVSLVLLLALPYLMLAMADDVALAPRRLRHAVLGLFVAFAVLGNVLAPIPGVLAFAAVAYFVLVMLYVGFVFLRLSRRGAATARRRMQAAALGAIFTGLIFVSGIVFMIGPLQGLDRQVPEMVDRVLVLLAAVSFFIAFMPPVFLRRSWREPYLRQFVASATAISQHDDLWDIVEKLQAAVIPAMGVNQVRIGIYDEPSDRFRFSSGEIIPREGTASGRAFDEQKASMSVHAPHARHSDVEQPVDPIVFAAPVTARGRRLGVLVAHASNVPLFADEELELLQLMADQVAVIIDGARLYVEVTMINRKLQDATRAKSEFLANMSHELRTPLNAILGFADLLSEQLLGSASERQIKYLRNISEAGEHLLHLINDVLDLSKVEAGRIEIHPEPIGTSVLLEPVLASGRELAAARTQRFAADLPADLSLWVDPGRVRQVLYNLISNAVKFTPEGGGVSLRVVAEGTTLVLEVSDTGPGIGEEFRTRIFGAFERQQGDVAIEGTGLGLALSKKLVELHDGTISYHSERGQGTTFTVRLLDAVPAGRPLRAPGGPQRVLVVEDDRRDAELVSALAAMLGLGVDVARSISDATRLLAHTVPIAVVLDLRLPDGRGDLVLGALKSDPRTRAVPVAIVTVEDDTDHSQPLGADIHITKPLDRARMLEWLSKLRTDEEGSARARVAG